MPVSIFCFQQILAKSRSCLQETKICTTWTKWSYFERQCICSFKFHQFLFLITKTGQLKHELSNIFVKLSTLESALSLKMAIKNGWMIWSMGGKQEKKIYHSWEMLWTTRNETNTYILNLKISINTRESPCKRDLAWQTRNKELMVQLIYFCTSGG